MVADPLSLPGGLMGASEALSVPSHSPLLFSISFLVPSILSAAQAGNPAASHDASTLRSALRTCPQLDFFKLQMSLLSQQRESLMSSPKLLSWPSAWSTCLVYLLTPGVFFIA